MHRQIYGKLDGAETLGNQKNEGRGLEEDEILYIGYLGEQHFE